MDKGRGTKRDELAHFDPDFGDEKGREPYRARPSSRPTSPNLARPEVQRDRRWLLVGPCWKTWHAPASDNLEQLAAECARTGVGCARPGARNRAVNLQTSANHEDLAALGRLRAHLRAAAVALRQVTNPPPACRATPLRAQIGDALELIEALARRARCQL